MNRIAALASGWGLVVGGGLASVMPPVVQALPADNFTDGTRGPEWSLVQDETALGVAETNGRLEVLASNPASADADVLYLSNGPAGFRLSTAGDFEIAIDYRFTAFTASTDSSTFGLVFGVGEDAAGTKSAAVGFGRADFGALVLSSLTVAHRTNNVQTIETPPDFAAPSSGTMRITYNAAGDDLSLGLDGSPALFTLQDTVRAVWGAQDLLVSFGARGNGFTTTSGQAYLDDFEVRTGTVVPEPASLSLLYLGAIAWGVRRRRDLRQAR